MKIYIQGYASFAESARQGYPGARSFNPDGSVKEPTTHLAKCQVVTCDATMIAKGYCLPHFRFYQAARSA